MVQKSKNISEFTPTYTHTLLVNPSDLCEVLHGYPEEHEPTSLQCGNSTEVSTEAHTQSTVDNCLTSFSLNTDDWLFPASPSPPVKTTNTSSTGSSLMYEQRRRRRGRGRKKNFGRRTALCYVGAYRQNMIKVRVIFYWCKLQKQRWVSVCEEHKRGWNIENRQTWTYIQVDDWVKSR